MSAAIVIDASALLAMLHREPGADAVAVILDAGVMSAVNWSEVVQKARGRGVPVDGLAADLASIGLEIVPFSVREAEAAADLWHRGLHGLALADRACLATAAVRGLPVITADRAWADAVSDVVVQVIR